MRRVPFVLTVLSGAVAVACAWVALRLIADSARDALTGSGAEVRVGALLMIGMACLLGGVAWQFLKMARTWLAIAQRVGRARAKGGDQGR